MSTAQPSISFVAYYRPYKGCYEFRITRTGDKELTYNLYKWSFDGDTQTVKQLGTGGKKTNASDADLLVVTSQGRGVASSGYLSVRNTPAGTVIKCGLLDGQNGKAVQSEIPKKVYEYTDNDSPLTKGSFGVGSVDCSAIFGQIAKHELTAAGEISSSLSDITSAEQSLEDGDWAYSIARFGDTSKEGTYKVVYEVTDSKNIDFDLIHSKASKVMKRVGEVLGIKPEETEIVSVVNEEEPATKENSIDSDTVTSELNNPLPDENPLFSNNITELNNKTPDPEDDNSFWFPSDMTDALNALPDLEVSNNNFFGNDSISDLNLPDLKIDFGPNDTEEN
jgi:hypothetical protein